MVVLTGNTLAQDKKSGAFRLPDTSSRVSVVGMTGSGKTQFASWLLSEAPFDQIPYIIVNFKNDELLRDIPRNREIGLSEKLPTEPGVYQVYPLPHQEEEIDDFLMRVWAQENTGLFIDEGFMVPRFSKGLSAVLTQGRSKHIPTIIGSQKPFFLNPFVLSQAEFHAIFKLQTPEDIKRMKGYIPNGALQPLPDYHSTWYDVGRDDLVRLGPVPRASAIHERFDERLKPHHTYI